MPDDGVACTASDTVPVLPKQQFDAAALERYLVAHVPGFAGPMTV